VTEPVHSHTGDTSQTRAHISTVALLGFRTPLVHPLTLDCEQPIAAAISRCVIPVRSSALRIRSCNVHSGTLLMSATSQR
jgi:hypothetical protein